MAEILGHATCTLADAKSLAWMSVMLVNAGEGRGRWGDGVPGRSTAFLFVRLTSNDGDTFRFGSGRNSPMPGALAFCIETLTDLSPDVKEKVRIHSLNVATAPGFTMVH